MKNKGRAQVQAESMCHHRRDPLQRRHHGTLVSHNTGHYILIDEVWQKGGPGPQSCNVAFSQEQRFDFKSRPSPPTPNPKTQTPLKFTSKIYRFITHIEF